MLFSELILNWWRRWRRLIIVVIFAIIFINLLFTRTFIILDISKPNGVGSTNIIATNADGVKKDLIIIGSIAFIERDTALLTVSSGELSTSIDITPLPILGIKSISLKLEKDRNVDKISGNNLGCSVYKKDSNILMSFSCTNPFGLFSYQTSTKDDTPWVNKQIIGFPQAYNAAPFSEGVLGIANNSSPWLFYVNASTNIVSEVRLPLPGMSKETISGLSIITDSSDPTKNHFLLVDNSTGIIWYGEMNGKNVTYKKYEHQISSKAPRFASSVCTLLGKNAYCYFGNTSVSPDSEGESLRYAKSGDGLIDIINFSTNTPVFNQYIVDKNNVIDRLFADENGQLYGYTSSSLYTLMIEGSSFRKVVLASNVGDAVGGKLLYYIKDNKLFEYNSLSKITKMRFISRNLRLSNINLFSNIVLINAYIKNAPKNTLHTYRLLDENNTTPEQRLVDLIPTYPTINQTGIVDMDYSSKTIHVVLPNYYEYSDGKLIPSTGIYNGQKSVIRNYLTGILPSINQYSLTFSHPDK